MISCRPRWFSASYDISGEGRSAVLKYRWIGEQGQVTTDGYIYDIVKQGFLSGRWVMRIGSEDVVTAQKESAFTRTFSIQSRVGNLTLQSKSIFGRAMVLTGSGFDAEITPKHLFSRAYQITGHVPNFEIACFAFWLTRMLQRRKNKDD